MGSITPTLLITAVGLIPDIRNIVSMDVKAPEDLVYIIGETRKELGGSQYYRLQNHLGKSVPKVRPAQAKSTFVAITEAIDKKLVKACHDLSEGGLAVAAAEMAFSGGYGLDLELGNVPCNARFREDCILFSESNSRFLVEIEPAAKGQFEHLMGKVVHSEIGKVTEASYLRMKGLKGNTVVEASLSELMTSWKRMSFTRREL
jgi:phosphoribosylformylglycinamidine synthase